MYDYIIVGAGSAGCVLAYRLTEDPETRVLLLEAGGRDSAPNIHIPAAFSKLFKTEHDWDYTTTPQDHLNGRELYVPRGKVLGGSSSINAMIYVRGNPEDYDGWARRGNDGWSYQEVLPYFKKSEANENGPSAYHGARGPLHVQHLRDPHRLTEAFVAAGVESGLPHNPDFNAGAQEGVGLTQVTQHRGRRASTAAAFLRPAQDRDNLVIETDAHATRIVLDGPRAVGVAYWKQGEEHVERVRQEVLLSTGAINSPHLLMLSGIGPADHLREHGIDVQHALPGVGQNLHDHLVYGVRRAVTAPITLAMADRFPRVVPNLFKYLLLRTGPFTSNMGEGLAFFRSRPDLPAPDLQFHFGPVRFERHGLEPPTTHEMTIGVTLLRPDSRGHVRLRSASPFDAPLIDPCSLCDPEDADLERLIIGARMARKVFEASAFESYRGEETAPGAGVQRDDAFADHIRATAEYLYHPVGTCAMGVDDDAVVDPELRVHGLDGLRVVDASVMPVVTRGNTNAPTIMIAEKAADLIRAGRRLKRRVIAA
jgi:choline dehydrogenase